MADHSDNTKLCPEAKISALVAAIGKDRSHEMEEVDRLLSDYPNDPRLHFLKGSLLAGRQDYVPARASMRHAVDLAPDYAIARFQLGFLLLTSGEPHAAQEAWGPLHALAADNYLRVFVIGLCHLIRDEFADAVRLLQDGMARNRDNPAMNRDMQLIVDEIHGKLSRGDGGEAPMSSVDFLLQQAALKSTRH
jgi:tetratricopeptide (TPR) repeat protein